jgi:hypothetical protein
MTQNTNLGFKNLNHIERPKRLHMRPIKCDKIIMSKVYFRSLKNIFIRAEITLSKRTYFQ